MKEGEVWMSLRIWAHIHYKYSLAQLTGSTLLCFSYVRIQREDMGKKVRKEPSKTEGPEDTVIESSILGGWNFLLVV